MSKSPVLALTPKPLPAAEALCIAAIEASDREQESGQHADHICLVIPNELPESRQQDLLDEFARRNRDASLIWRPVAAAFEWLRLHGAELTRTVEKETCVGTLLSLHLGVDGLEACLLELILREDSGDWVLPARQRPHDKNLSLARGRSIMESAVAAARYSAGANDHELDNWRALWASPIAAQQVLNSAAARSAEMWGIPDGFSWQLREALAESCRKLHKDKGWPQLSNLVAVLGSASSRSEGKLLRGAVVTGELAAIAQGLDTLGAALVRAIVPQLNGSVVVEGANGVGRDLLARGAELFAARRDHGLPTYLDTLPQMEVLLERRAMPVWVPLLQSDQRYVEGGRKWRRSPDLGGLFVAAHSTELALKLYVEPEKYARGVHFSLSEPPTGRVAVKLSAEMKPAGGQARVELLPENADQLGSRRVVLDWTRAIELGKTKQEIADSYPRKCPAVIPRRAWFGAWSLMAGPLKRLSAGGSRALQQAVESGSPVLGKLREAVNASPRGFNANVLPIGAAGIGIERAVDSYGKLHVAHRDKQLEFEGFIRDLAEVQIQSLNSGHSVNGDVLRILGYACARGGAVNELISRVQLEAALGHDPAEAIFLGGCMGCSSSGRGLEGMAKDDIPCGCLDCLEARGRNQRGAEQARRYIDVLLSRMDADWTGFNVLLQWAGYHLQWREYALAQVSTETAYRLTFQARQVIAAAAAPWLVVGPRPAPKGAQTDLAFLERGSLVLIAYLLRKRIDDDGYLEPRSPKAKELRLVLATALRRLRRGELTSIGGSVRTEVLLARVLKYIKRKGSGTVIAD